MKKRLLALAGALALLLSGCNSAQPAGQEEGTLHILATTYPVYLFTTAVTQGVEGVEVSLLVKEQVSCLHDYTLTVTDMKAIEKADVLVVNGAGLEDFMEDALAASDAPVIDCSAAVELLPTLEHAGHDGHDHEEELDPHIWMDPRNAQQMVATIGDGLTALTGLDFSANASAAQSQLETLTEQWEGVFDGEGLITFHDGFQYFARCWGLDLLKAIEEEEGSTASAAEVKEMVSLMDAYDIPAIFTEVNGSTATAKAIARETGCGVYSLNMIMSGEGSGIQPYLDAMTANLETLREALK